MATAAAGTAISAARRPSRLRRSGGGAPGGWVPLTAGRAGAPAGRGASWSWVTAVIGSPCSSSASRASSDSSLQAPDQRWRGCFMGCDGRRLTSVVPKNVFPRVRSYDGLRTRWSPGHHAGAGSSLTASCAHSARRRCRDGRPLRRVAGRGGRLGPPAGRLARARGDSRRAGHRRPVLRCRPVRRCRPVLRRRPLRRCRPLRRRLRAGGALAERARRSRPADEQVLVSPRPHVRAIDVFGGTAVVQVAGPGPNGVTPQLAAVRAAVVLRRIHAELTRFDAASPLSRLNADPRDDVPAPPLVRALARAVRDAGEISDGLVDGTILPELEGAGYDRDRPPVPPAGLPTAIGEAAPARPDRRRRWARVRVDEAGGLVRRPSGVRLDGGGLVKGMACDMLAARLATHALFAVDCGGDLRFGGAAGGR